MHLLLTFTADGCIEGEGIDDIARFLIDGSFDHVISGARWLKRYVGMHTVAYSGLYCGGTICGDWHLGLATGGFWISPCSTAQSEFAHEEDEAERPILSGSGIR